MVINYNTSNVSSRQAMGALCSPSGKAFNKGVRKFVKRQRRRSRVISKFRRIFS